MPRRGDVSSRLAKKRKSGLDDDTTAGAKPRGDRRKRREDNNEEDEQGEPNEDTSPPPPQKRSKRKEKQQRASSPSDDQTNEETLSVDATNALRAKLGLAPLQMDDKSTVRDSETGDPKEKIVVEDGFEFTHRVADDWGEKKRQEAIKEKLETSKEKRRVYSKVLKVKGLAEEEDEADSASSWVEKMRRAEEEKRLAEQRAKALEEMDAEFGVDRLLDEEKKTKKPAKQKRPGQNKSDLANMTVAHSKEAFLEGRDTVLVLQDKDVLDDSEEVLINPNIVDEERYRKNVENRKKKDRYNAYDDEVVDEMGVARKQDLLAKYNEEMEGPKKETFRLDELGNVDINEETRQLEIRRQLHATTHNLISLETPRMKIASEFYTQEEMVSFKKPKKGKEGKKIRKRGGTLKADDLMPEANSSAKDLGSRSKPAAKKAIPDEKGGWGTAPSNGDGPEEGEIEPGMEEDRKSSPKKKNETAPMVDLSRLAKIAEQSDEESDDEAQREDLTMIRIDDDAEDELAAMLQMTRRLKTDKRVADRNAADAAAAKVREMLAAHGGKLGEIKKEEEEMDDETAVTGSDVVIDATSEYCRNLGEIPTYGLAGNRLDAIDMDELVEKDGEVKPAVAPVPVEASDSDEEAAKKKKRKERHREKRRSKDGNERMDTESASTTSKGVWLEATATTSAVIRERAKDREREKKRDRERREKRDGEDDSDEEAYNVLGAEADVTKGVGAMLKLAGQKGYLELEGQRHGAGPSLEHLKSKRYSQVEAGRFDMEEKYTKKLERMGTTGSGPVRSFPEKRGYAPEVKINYTDELGRDMDAKDAFRVLSWKFHGKGPGKKQIGKRMEKRAKKELLKKMNSSDTPLGTLEKQVKKQAALQTPYLVLSGGNKDGAPLKKD